MSSSESDGPEDRNSQKVKKAEAKKRKLDDVKKEESLQKEEEKKIDLGSNRFVSVSEFKGKNYLNIREFYLDKNSGELKPGKKGISLTPLQWNKLFAKGEQINQWFEEL